MLGALLYDLIIFGFLHLGVFELWRRANQSCVIVFQCARFNPCSSLIRMVLEGGDDRYKPRSCSSYTQLFFPLNIKEKSLEARVYDRIAQPKRLSCVLVTTGCLFGDRYVYAILEKQALYCRAKMRPAKLDVFHCARLVKFDTL